MCDDASSPPRGGVRRESAALFLGSLWQTPAARRARFSLPRSRGESRWRRCHDSRSRKLQRTLLGSPTRRLRSTVLEGDHPRGPLVIPDSLCWRPLWQLLALLPRGSYGTHAFQRMQEDAREPDESTRQGWVAVGIYGRWGFACVIAVVGFLSVCPPHPSRGRSAPNSWPECK